MTKIVTIGREIGSGGRELGRLLAEKLGFAYYDQEIINEIANRTALSESYIQNIERNCFDMPFPIHIACSFSNPEAELNRSIYATQCDIILEMAQKSDCVIVGRCADFILKDLKPFRIFVYADEKSKMNRCRKNGDGDMTDREIKSEISKVDKSRAKYYNDYTLQKWGEKENYDLCINTSDKELDDIAEALVHLIK